MMGLLLLILYLIALLAAPIPTVIVTINRGAVLDHRQAF